jgi:hypothetical protein
MKEIMDNASEVVQKASTFVTGKIAKAWLLEDKFGTWKALANHLLSSEELGQGEERTLNAAAVMAQQAVAVCRTNIINIEALDLILRELCSEQLKAA